MSQSLLNPFLDTEGTAPETRPWQRPRLVGRPHARYVHGITEAIVTRVSAYLNVDPDLVLGKRRKYPIARARAVSVYVVREKYGYSTPLLGKYFGREHATIIHLLGRAEEILAEDPALRAFVEALIKERVT